MEWKEGERKGDREKKKTREGEGKKEKERDGRSLFIPYFHIAL